MSVKTRKAISVLKYVRIILEITLARVWTDILDQRNASVCNYLSILSVRL